MSVDYYPTERREYIMSVANQVFGAFLGAMFYKCVKKRGFFGAIWYITWQSVAMLAIFMIVGNLLGWA